MAQEEIPQGGAGGLTNRIAAWKLHHNAAPPVDLAVISETLDLSGHGCDSRRLIEAARVAGEARGKPVRVLAVDTVSRVLAGADENSPAMAGFVSTCGKIAEALDCLVLAIHHRPKSSESTEPRGHGSLKAGADAVFLVEGTEGARRLNFQKMKESELSPPLGFRLRRVELGLDDEGEAVSSCVVEPLDAPPPPRAAGRKLTDGQALALRALADSIRDEGETLPPGCPAALRSTAPDGRASLVRTWAERWKSMADPDQSPDRSPDHYRRMFDKHRDRLQVLDLIAIWEGYAWPKG